MKTFSAILALCAGNSPVNYPHKGQWRGALMFSLICAWINDWVNNREASDLRRYRGHYDVNVMESLLVLTWPNDDPVKWCIYDSPRLNEFTMSTFFLNAGRYLGIIFAYIRFDCLWMMVDHMLYRLWYIYIHQQHLLNIRHRGIAVLYNIGICYIKDVWSASLLQVHLK